MKKIALIILTLITNPTYATTMCAANNTVAVVLDPTISFTNGHTYDKAMFTWKAWSVYGTISGISACINKGQGYSIGTSEAHLRDINNSGENKLIKGTEKYGQYCWCKMTHPASSFWIFLRNYIDNETCYSNCVNSCGDLRSFNMALQKGYFLISH